MQLNCIAGVFNNKTEERRNLGKTRKDNHWSLDHCVDGAGEIVLLTSEESEAGPWFIDHYIDGSGDVVLL